MSPMGSDPQSVLRAATNSLTAIPGIMVKNGHLRHQMFVGCSCRTGSLAQARTPAPVSVSTDGEPAVVWLRLRIHRRGELSHGIVEKGVDQGVQAGRRPARREIMGRDE